MSERKSLRGRLADNSPNPVDVYVGKRMRLRRQILRMTQQELAELLGVSFQQIQKYEKGDNRIGASRLWDIAQVLNAPIGYFYEGMDGQTAALSPRNKTEESEEIIIHFEDPMHSIEIVELSRNYLKIKNRMLAKNVFDAIAKMAKSN